MIQGLEKFREHFEEYKEFYVIIGGTACYYNFHEIGLSFWATQDIDILIILEKYDAGFNKHFWSFIRKAGYSNILLEESERKFYRFTHPSDSTYPKQIEILCRHNKHLEADNDQRIIAIDPGEDFSHLSAIALDDEYYKFTIANSRVVEGVSIAGIESLICLKSQAYLNLKKHVNEERSKDILKHMKDVLRLSVLLNDEKYSLPQKLKQDLAEFLEMFDKLLLSPDFMAMYKGLKLKEISAQEIIILLRNKFLYDFNPEQN